MKRRDRLAELEAEVRLLRALLRAHMDAHALREANK